VSTLVVVAHPDDEVLGCGGLLWRLHQAGEPSHCVILSGKVSARRHRPELPELHANVRAAHAVLGVESCRLGPFPNIAFNEVRHLDMVQFIEAAIRETAAVRVITHHPGDLNNDHLHTALACGAAARLAQRDGSAPPLRELLYMEVPSSTDWAFPGAGSQFMPTAFIGIGEDGLARKLEALRAYEGVMRPYPHPRSEEALRGLAAVRGGQCGEQYAEAFQVAFTRLASER
jgi:LmbE family N-acetylglucosaminyl deacetylase